ncbi:MAG: hypothetical protein ACJA0H_000829 [Francisellaceae bacterium]|jgi:hypothetical protein
MTDKFSFYKEYPKTCADDDFWGQVKRTVNGESVSDDQINMIVQASTNSLELNENDTLLDLCCGNGALSDRLFAHCNGGLGVDFSEHLVAIANKYFSKPANREFVVSDVIKFCQQVKQAENFTKAICYGSFSYLEEDKAELLLVQLYKSFSNVKYFYIGNCPDKALSDKFFEQGNDIAYVLNDPSSAIGIWRTKEEFCVLANRTGWKITFRKMPDLYYAAHYRYDVLLSRV